LRGEWRRERLSEKNVKDGTPSARLVPVEARYCSLSLPRTREKEKEKERERERIIAGTGTGRL